MRRLSAAMVLTTARAVSTAWWRSIGSPKHVCAPMVDQSELAFRMLCRNHGATAAYTPMIHSRLYAEGGDKFCDETFSTTVADRPLFVQFCANDPDVLVKAAKKVQATVDAMPADADGKRAGIDYVDLNLGCPQRIAKRGNYGAFLMDDLKLVSRIVKTATSTLSIPVSCKIRCFDSVEETVRYATMIVECGCSVLGVHGRTREQKDLTATRADWDKIKAVVDAVGSRVPVIANGNVRHYDDAIALMNYTGANGVMSAEGLLSDPALFGRRVRAGVASMTSVDEAMAQRTRYSEPDPSTAEPVGALWPASGTEGCDLLREYLELTREYATPMRMVRAHAHRMLGEWLKEFHDVRDKLVRCHGTPEEYRNQLLEVSDDLRACIVRTERDFPVEKLTDRALRRLEEAKELEERKAEAIRQQAAEESMLASL